MFTKETVIAMMETDQSFLEKCIVTIYEKQTEDEQRTKETRHNNGVGFTHGDSIRGSWYAQHILRGLNQYRKVYGNNLTGEHIIKARKFMKKYAGQVIKFADALESKGVMSIAA